MKTAYLVDGNSYFFRAFHGIGNLSRSSDGMPTGAVFGLVNSLRQMLRTYSPDALIVAWDSREPTFRHELDDSYKSNREATPEDLVVQIPYMRQALSAMGIPMIARPGYEADDILGTLADRLAREGWDVVIASGDKDLMQLVGKNIRVLRQHLNNTKIYGEKEVRERYQVGPERLRDVFGLMGDTVDNIPGVPGIGEKTAVDLVVRFGSLESLYSNLDQVKGQKRRDSLREYREQAFRSRDLATICRDVPLELEEKSLAPPSPDTTELLRVYRELEFRTLARELEEQHATAHVLDTESRSAPTAANYEIVPSRDRLQTVVEEIRKSALVAVDTETTSLNTNIADLVGLSLSIRAGQAWYIPVAHRDGDCVPLSTVKELLGPLLADPRCRKCGQNLKFDYQILSRSGLTLAGIVHDSLVASYLCEPERSTRKLDVLAAEHLGMRMTPIEDLIGSGKKQKSFAEVPIERAGPYSCEDADAAFRLAGFYEERLHSLGLKRLYEEVEMPLVSVLAEMEMCGVKVDQGTLEEQSRELGTELESLEKEIYREAGREFNINSPSQLAAILYDEKRLLTGRKKSTRADILEQLASEGHKIAVLMMEYRQRAKLQSTYLEGLKELIDPQTGRVHTSYNQTIVNTGRISSSSPNLQNIPIRTPLGHRVRRAYVAEKGNLLLSADYSQIELRIMAHLSKDPGLLEAFGKGEDIHRRTAAEVFGVSLQDVSSDMRRKAKEINFGLNYGMSPYGLSQRLAIPVEEAKDYVERYFDRYPRVREHMDEIAHEAAKNGCVRTILGRRIPTPGLGDSNRARAENARRAAINAPIQGSAADLLKKAMVDCHRRLAGKPVNMILTVHDELVFEVKESIVEETAQEVRETMETALAKEITVPTPVEVSWGNSWAEL
ncbi:MAG TPA: DNA polymerase I [bacterium]|nr:DNA polymerase I [bacterium]